MRKTLFIKYIPNKISAEYIQRPEYIKTFEIPEYREQYRFVRCNPLIKIQPLITVPGIFKRGLSYYQYVARFFEKGDGLNETLAR